MDQNVALSKPEPIPLDAPSEGILIWEQERFPQTDYGAFSLSGPCDVGAFARALREAQAGFPKFHAYLVPYRRGVWTTLGWMVQPPPVELEVYDMTSQAEAPADMESWIHETMAPMIAHVQDLKNAYPVRLLLFCLPAERHVFVFLFHHVVIDGGGFYNFLVNVFRIYHRLVTGEEPEWAGVAGLHAQAGDLRPITPIPAWRLVRELFAEWRKYPMRRVAQIDSRPTASSGRKIVRHLVEDRVLQKALRERARRDGGSLSDLFLAASKLALEEFNADRGADFEIMLHGLAVNQRLRRTVEETAGQGNPMGGIGISSNSTDRRDPEALLRWVISERKRKMEAGYDLWLSWLGRQLINWSRVLPVGMRARALRPFFDMRLSFFLTNLGVVLPRMENGRPTGETAIREVGRMQLVDVHTSVGTTEKNGATLILRTFLDRLYLVFQFGQHQIADDDAESFARLVVDHVQRYL
ncbi:MAG: hypothetical protein ACTSXZ_01755 [Alphaproteobacteria bacterium]